MHDFFINYKPPKEGKPSKYTEDQLRGCHPYIHIFINVNTRFVIAFPVYTRDAAKVKLQRFFSVMECKKLISDAESAFLENSVVQLCENKNVDVVIIDEGNHQSLSIVDRFIRTLRDKHNTQTAGSLTVGRFLLRALTPRG